MSLGFVKMDSLAISNFVTGMRKLSEIADKVTDDLENWTLYFHFGPCDPDTEFFYGIVKILEDYFPAGSWSLSRRFDGYVLVSLSVYPFLTLILLNYGGKEKKRSTRK